MESETVKLLKTPIQMYKLTRKKKSTRVVCESCYKRKFVSDKCPACSGKGIVNRKLEMWHVNKHTTAVYKIDREKSTGRLRYWESSNEFFYEVTSNELNNNIEKKFGEVHLLSFSLADAENEARRLNELIAKV